MKKKILMIIAILICGMMTMFAQNNKISYQAVVRNLENQLVVNTELTVNVSLANSENGQAVYSEKHTVTSNANGLISLLIGNGTDVQGNWEDIDWSSAWVTTWIYDGQEQLASHKVPFSAVPYALHAGYADSVNQNQIANYLDQHGITNPVQSDWNVTDADNDAYIKNKPNISDSIGSYLNQSTVMSQHLERIIDAYNQDYLEQFYGDLSIMQSDWNENNTFVTSFIKNKPNISDSIGNYLTTNKYVNEDNICTTITNKCSDLFTEGQSDWDETNSTNGAYIKNKPNISDSIKFYVYNNLCSDINDLDNWSTSSPWCSVLQSDWNQTTPGFTSYIKNKPDLSVYATKDTLKYYTTSDKVDTLLNAYEKKADLCKDVKECIKDTLSKYTTTDHLDSVINKHGYLTRDSALIVMMRDSIQKVNAHVIEDSLVLATRIYEDSVALHKAIKDTAAAIRNDICDSATVCITKALADAASEINHAVDTIALNVVKDTLKAYYDTTRVKELVHDTIVKYLTINKYVNEDNICATIEDKCTNVPLKSDTNRFTNHNDLTDGSITVPSNPDAIERPSTFGACDNMNAVNVCDLLAMFDSLSNRIQGVYDSLKRVTDSLAEELNNLKNSVPPTADAPTIKHLAPTTLTVKANNTSPVSPITSYKYCYSTNADMSDAICQTSTYDTLDLSGLTPNTDYYFTVEATNIAGSTTSNITTERTPAHAPTAGGD